MIILFELPFVGIITLIAVMLGLPISEALTVAGLWGLLFGGLLTICARDGQKDSAPPVWLFTLPNLAVLILGQIIAHSAVALLSVLPLPA